LPQPTTDKIAIKSKSFTIKELDLDAIPNPVR
jgi:hypothetical protein